MLVMTDAEQIDRSTKIDEQETSPNTELIASSFFRFTSLSAIFAYLDICRDVLLTILGMNNKVLSTLACCLYCCKESDQSQTHRSRYQTMKKALRIKRQRKKHHPYQFNKENEQICGYSSAEDTEAYSNKGAEASECDADGGGDWPPLTKHSGKPEQLKTSVMRDYRSGDESNTFRWAQWPPISSEPQTKLPRPPEPEAQANNYKAELEHIKSNMKRTVLLSSFVKDSLGLGELNEDTSFLALNSSQNSNPALDGHEQLINFIIKDHNEKIIEHSSHRLGQVDSNSDDDIEPWYTHPDADCSHVIHSMEDISPSDVYSKIEQVIKQYHSQDDNDDKNDRILFFLLKRVHQYLTVKERAMEHTKMRKGEHANLKKLKDLNRSLIQTLYVKKTKNMKQACKYMSIETFMKRTERQLNRELRREYITYKQYKEKLDLDSIKSMEKKMARHKAFELKRQQAEKKEGETIKSTRCSQPTVNTNRPKNWLRCCTKLACSCSSLKSNGSSISAENSSSLLLPDDESNQGEHINEAQDQHDDESTGGRSRPATPRGIFNFFRTTGNGVVARNKVTDKDPGAMDSGNKAPSPHKNMAVVDVPDEKQAPVSPPPPAVRPKTSVRRPENGRAKSPPPKKKRDRRRRRRYGSQPQDKAVKQEDWDAELTIDAGATPNEPEVPDDKVLKANMPPPSSPAVLATGSTADNVKCRVIHCKENHVIDDCPVCKVNRRFGGVDRMLADGCSFREIMDQTKYGKLLVHEPVDRVVLENRHNIRLTNMGMLRLIIDGLIRIPFPPPKPKAADVKIIGGIEATKTSTNKGMKLMVKAVPKKGGTPKKEDSSESGTKTTKNETPTATNNGTPVKTETASPTNKCNRNTTADYRSSPCFPPREDGLPEAPAEVDGDEVKEVIEVVDGEQGAQAVDSEPCELVEEHADVGRAVAARRRSHSAQPPRIGSPQPPPRAVDDGALADHSNDIEVAAEEPNERRNRRSRRLDWPLAEEAVDTEPAEKQPTIPDGATFDFSRNVVEPGQGERPNKKRLKDGIKGKVKTKGQPNKHLQKVKTEYPYLEYNTPVEYEEAGAGCFDETICPVREDPKTEIIYNETIADLNDMLGDVPEPAAVVEDDDGPMLATALPQTIDDRQYNMVPEEILRKEDDKLKDLEDKYYVAAPCKKDKRKRKDKKGKSFQPLRY